jgi:hypothetical protein
VLVLLKLLFIKTKNMFSQRTTTILLIVTIAVLSFQTITLARMSSKLKDAQIGIGNSPTGINFTDNGSSPQMVGGC